MSRCIDADALRDRLQNLGYDDWNQGVTTTWAEAFNECADMVDEQPTIELEIVRCKDCKHGAPNGRYGCRVYHYKRYETHDMKPDDFCSYAERRTDE